MMDTTWIYIILFIFTSAVIALLVTYYIFLRPINEIKKEIADIDPVKLDSTANFFGFESKGLTQVRGNGVLALTEYELIFNMVLPRNRFDISLKSINKVSTTRSHLGKTKAHDLLKIDFTNENGSKDSAAWRVEDVDEWVEEIQKQM